MILSFAYLEGQILKSHKYSSSYTEVGDNTKEIGIMLLVLCYWL